MRKPWIIVLVGLFTVSLIGIALAHGPGYGPWTGHMGAWQGSPMMGYAHPGRMASGWGHCPGMSGYGYGYRYDNRYSHWTWPIQQDQAKQVIEGYLEDTRSRYLKAGDVQEKEDYFEVEVVTKKEGALVARLGVDKDTGQIEPVE